MNWKIFLKGYLFLLVIIFGCSVKTEVDSASHERLETWYGKIISSRDSIVSNKSFYLKEANKWLHTSEIRDDNSLLGKTYFILAKTYSWSDEDSIARIYFDLALPLLEQSEKENAIQLIDICYNLALFDVQVGDLQTSNVLMAKSAYYADKYYSEEPDLQKLILRTYMDYGAINRVLQNNEIAITYLEKAISLSIKTKKSDATIKCYADLGSVFSNQKKWDRAEYYFLKAEDLVKDVISEQDYVFNHLAGLYYKKKEFEKSKRYLDKELVLQPVEDSVMFSINYSGVFLGLKQPDKAKKYIDYLLLQYQKLAERDKLLVVTNLLTYFIQIKDAVNAEKYLLEAEELQEAYYSSEKAMFSQDLIKKYELKVQQDKIDMLHQERELINSKLKQKNYWILFFIVVFLAFLGLIWIIVLRQKNKKITYEVRLRQMEDTLLRSQMEPHFVFNAMSSLQSLMLDNKNEESANYLTKFARLLRLSLEHSRKKYVPFLEEKEGIENYLLLQKLRFGDLFTFNIDYSSIEDIDFSVPPLMIQPFVENAIYHGFSNIDYLGVLEIDFQMQNQYLHCTIVDNGIGLNSKSRYKSNEKSSLSTLITKERLQVLSNLKNIDGLMVIKANDNNTKGTTVVLKLPIILE